MRSATLIGSACLALGVADLVVLNGFLVPAWLSSSTSNRVAAVVITPTVDVKPIEKPAAVVDEKPLVDHEPVAEKPVVDEAPVVAERPVVETPVVEKPVVETPVAEKSPANPFLARPVVAEKPTTEKPVTDKPDPGRGEKRAGEKLVVLFISRSALVSADDAALVAEYVKRFPGQRFTLRGHTDSIGAEAGNVRLSIARANAIASVARAAGVPAEQLRVLGFGASQPLNPAQTEEAFEQNRRVEITPERGAR